MRKSITWKIGDIFLAIITPNGGPGLIQGIVTGEDKSIWLVTLKNGGLTTTPNKQIPEKAKLLDDPVQEKKLRALFDAVLELSESSVTLLQK